MKSFTRLGLFMGLLIGLAVPLTVQAGGEKASVCHLDKASGTFLLIHVSVAALSAHVNHGDALPGEPVPGMPDYQFDENCEPVTVGLAAGCYPSQGNSLLWSGGVGPGNGDFYPANVFDCSGRRSGHATYVVAEQLADAVALCSRPAGLTTFHPNLYVCFGTVVIDR
jgi:hypothetical protein